MKTLKKIAKYLLILAVVITTIGFLLGVVFYHQTTHGITLNHEKLGSLKQSNNLEIYDANGEKISVSYETFVPINKLSNHTKNAFIAAEDKRFYTHSGVDYIRIFGALISNIKTKSFSQGASTISQQLIKNTQLSSEKTIKRKLKEIKLTNQLEKEFSKNDILEMYLNNIYFGNGCYGIENASKHYFGKSSTKLTLAESALLAGTINAPSHYDIEEKTQNAKKRRDLILNLMHKYKKISNEEKNQALNENINLNLTDIKSNGYILGEVIKEACSLTGKTENQLKSSNYKIQTHINLNTQNKINTILKTNFSNIETNPQIASIVIDNKTNGIIAVLGNKSTLSSPQQPGSTIKPILVYAPMIEADKISPATRVLDEKINISGYSPENADKKYHGYISVREAIKNSYNTPAVKLLNEFGVKNAQEFATKLGFTFTKQDNHLAIALGSLSNGVHLKTLADAYKTFACNGQYSQSNLIKSISLNNNTISTNNQNSKQVLKNSTAFLITNMLCDTSKTGTGKRLKDFNFDIATKTGTVGITNSSKNSAAISISYTTDHTILTFIGGNSMPENINGATYPTLINKSIIELLYKNNKPKNFTQPTSVEIKHLISADYNNNIISETNDESASFNEYFSKSNPPQKNHSSLLLDFEVFNFKNQKPIICFHASPEYSYSVIRTQKNEEKQILFIKNQNDLIKFEDITAKRGEVYDYHIKIQDSNQHFKTQHKKLKVF